MYRRVRPTNSKGQSHGVVLIAINSEFESTVVNGKETKEIGDKQKLQDDIDKLVRWSEQWQMLFNFGKCKCLHTGPGNTGINYEMGGTILSKTVKEKDLGISMNANMKVSEQCRIAASKGNQVLGMIRRNITYKEKSLIVPLYKAIVRPHLEY